MSCPCDVVDVASGDRIRKAGDQPIAVIDESRDRALDEATLAVGIKVAERIINRREDFFGGLSSLTDLAGIPYLGADKFNDLLYSFHQTVYEVSGIEFNIASGSIANDGLNIRRNSSSTTSSPRWTRGHAFTHRDSPVAYTIKETDGNALAIRVTLRASDISSAFVRAIGGGTLGPVKEHFVAFNGTGVPATETFQLENPTFHGLGVGVHDITWRWQWRRHPSDPWRDIVRTRHRLFVTLEEPTLPWVQTPGSTSLPWADALEIACNWAKGATDKDTAAGLIAERFNSSSRVSYETFNGITCYGFDVFNLTEMIERLNGGIGLGEKVNCTDCANAVTTLANLLGCDLWQSRIRSTSFFELNPIIVIGYSDWAVPFFGSFSYHEVAWKGAATQHDNLFDACLKVDGGANPNASPPGVPLLPKDMLFGSCGSTNYRLRLSPNTPGGCGNCQPDPSTRQRRPII